MRNPDWLEERVPPEEWGDVVTDGSLQSDMPEPMVSRSVRLPVDLYQWLRSESADRGLGSWSELLRVLAEDARRPASEAVVPVRELEALIAQHRSAA